MEKKADDFIQKTIKKTKDNTLIWNILSPDFKLKRIASAAKYLSSFIPGPITDSPQLCIDDSYISNYGDGYLLLLIYRKDSSVHSLPLIETTLSLRMQDKKSKYAVEICNSDSDEETRSALIRLYNLVDQDLSSVNALIKDFLDS